MKKLLIAIAVTTSALAVHTGATAQFLKNPLGAATGGGSSGGQSANAGQVLRNTRDALLSFVKAEAGLSLALGGYADLAAQQQLLDNIKTGDAAAKKEDLETIIKVHASCDELIRKKAADNAALEAQNKALAGKSMVAYVNGLVSTRKLVGSIQDLGRNPMSLGSDAPTMIYVAKEVPSVASGAASTTGKLMKYLTANGVDMSDAKKAADDLGT